MNSSFAKKAYRNILLSFRDMSMEEYMKVAENLDELESNLTILGMVSLQDPIRAEICDSI